MRTRSAVIRLFTILGLTLGLIAASLSYNTASAATTWKPRGEQYAQTVTEPRCRDPDVRRHDPAR